MTSFKFRIKASGQPDSVLGPLEPTLTLRNLRELVAKSTRLRANRLQLLAGFPPKEISAKSDTQLKDLGVQSGVSFVVREGDSEIADHQQQAAPASGDSKGPAQTLPPLPPLVRRIIDHDNSCLFNAVGYVCAHDKQASELLRATCASIVADNKAVYTEAFLGKKNDDYVTYLLNPEKWGGAIEIAILAEHYSVELAAVDIQTAIPQVFGQGKGYKKRGYLIYNGIHYDALVHNPRGEQGDEKEDILLFDPADERVKQQAVAFAKDLQKQKQYTNVNSFSLRCDVCQQGFVGAVEASEHAKSTGHRNFSEYK